MAKNLSRAKISEKPSDAVKNCRFFPIVLLILVFVNQHLHGHSGFEETFHFCNSHGDKVLGIVVVLLHSHMLPGNSSVTNNSQRTASQNREKILMVYRYCLSS